MLWLIWFGIVFSYYGIFTWLPSLLVKEGYTIVQSFEYVLVMILAQLPGYIAAAWLVEKLGRKGDSGWLYRHVCDFSLFLWPVRQCYRDRDLGLSDVLL